MYGGRRGYTGDFLHRIKYVQHAREFDDPEYHQKKDDRYKRKLNRIDTALPVTTNVCASINFPHSAFSRQLESTDHDRLYKSFRSSCRKCAV